MQGFGTEKVEEEIAGQFPAVKVERLDFDTARTARLTSGSSRISRRGRHKS